MSLQKRFQSPISDSSARIRLQWLIIGLFLLLGLGSSFGEARFPPPDFSETNHQIPVTTAVAARAVWVGYLDVGVLAAALGLATWLIYKQRSRRGLFWLGLFSIAYFGFWRKGCVCSIGSPQNIALGLFDSSYAVPITVTAFFSLPLLVALFAGRSFCAGVCPHGALQDLVLIKPTKVPAWLEQGLSILPFIFLGAGVWLAATGSIFLFCQYDPFVPLFRFGGRSAMVLTGVGLLALGTVVGRPYCRFACPYGALLKLGAMVAKWRVRVTPDICTQCKLCEPACPFGAMRSPESGTPPPGQLASERRLLAAMIIAIPVLTLLGAWLGGLLAGPASRLNPQVALAERYLAMKDTPALPTATSPDELALNRARLDSESLLTKAKTIQRQVEIGGWIFGAWVGLVIGGKLVRLAVRRTRLDYEPDRGACFACARCFESCPQELLRLDLTPVQNGSSVAANLSKTARGNV